MTAYYTNPVNLFEEWHSETQSPQSSLKVIKLTDTRIAASYMIVNSSYSLHCEAPLEQARLQFSSL